MVESNRSASPLREADARLEAMERREEFSASWGDRGRGNGGRNRRPGVLHGAVGVQEVPAQVHDGPAPPAHHHPGDAVTTATEVGFQVLRLGGGDESVCV